MQAWLWAERFPDAMDGVVPIACYPMQISGRNLMWRQIVINAVRNDPKWHGGNYSPADPPTAWKDVAGLMFPMMVGTAERLQASGPDREHALAHDADLIADYRTRDADDSLYDYESSADYDPGPDIEKITAPLNAINFADDLVTPPTLPIAANTVGRLSRGQFTLVPGGWGHAGIFHVDEWAAALQAFLRTLPEGDEAHRV